jgi:hypothetical protein
MTFIYAPEVLKIVCIRAEILTFRSINFGLFRKRPDSPPPLGGTPLHQVDIQSVSNLPPLPTLSLSPQTRAWWNLTLYKSLRLQVCCTHMHVSTMDTRFKFRIPFWREFTSYESGNGKIYYGKTLEGNQKVW